MKMSYGIGTKHYEKKTFPLEDYRQFFISVGIPCNISLRNLIILPSGSQVKKNKLHVLADQLYLLQQLHITCSPPRSINGLRNGFVENPAFINLRCQMTKLILSGKFHHLVLRSRISTFMAYKPRRRVIFLRILLHSVYLTTNCLKSCLKK